MARHAKTIRLIEEAQLALAEHHPMAARQAMSRTAAERQALGEILAIVAAQGVRKECDL